MYFIYFTSCSVDTDTFLSSALFYYTPLLLPYVLWDRQGRLRLKCDGTRAETRFRLSAKRTSPFKSAGASVQSTTGSRGVRINGSSGSNAGHIMFRGSVKSTGYPLHSQVSPFTSPPVRHRVPSHFNWTLPLQYSVMFWVCVEWTVTHIGQLCLFALSDIWNGLRQTILRLSVARILFS